jgi:hypothetical protein
MYLYSFIEFGSIKKILNLNMMSLIVTPKNKKEETVLKAFLNRLQIGFHLEEDEDATLHNAMLKGRKTSLLNKTEKEEFLNQLRHPR